MQTFKLPPADDDTAKVVKSAVNGHVVGKPTCQISGLFATNVNVSTVVAPFLVTTVMLASQLMKMLLVTD